jgi:hypothetical protein
MSNIPKLDLLCWVINDDPKHGIPVSVTSSTIVATLKEIIKDKKFPADNSFTADTLNLWKVKIPGAMAN